MADQIEGNYCFFVEGAAWHKKGEVISREKARTLTTAEFCHKAYGGRELQKCPITYPFMLPDGERVTADFKTGCVIVRDDGAEIGQVGSGFELVQPEECFNALEPMREKGLLEFEAGGSLQGGKRLWALGKVADCISEVLPGDPIQTYVLIYTGFDGSLSVGISPTNVRVVCANTLAAARGENDEGIKFKHRHTKSVRTQISASMLSIEATIEAHKVTIETYKALARKQVKRAAQEQYVADVILTPEIAAKADVELSAQQETKINRVIELLDTQRGLELVPAMRGTAWQAYNAVTEYITHETGRNEDTGLNSQWFGATANLNRQALKLAQAL